MLFCNMLCCTVLVLRHCLTISGRAERWVRASRSCCIAVAQEGAQNTTLKVILAYLVGCWVMTERHPTLHRAITGGSTEGQMECTWEHGAREGMRENASDPGTE
jgi:hypothetical protein